MSYSFMVDYKIVLGIIAVAIGLFSFIPYFRDIYNGKTKPHAFSWLIWALLSGIIFIGQILNNGGAGAWVTGFSSVVSFIIFYLALIKGEKNITRTDTYSLVGAILALIIWIVTKNPLGSVILITLIDALGYYPTFRKSYHNPFQETSLTFFLAGTKYVVAFFALGQYSIITYLYPVALIVMNYSLSLMLIVMRKVKNKN
jgi:FtsH-binding integral membrane protein